MYGEFQATSPIDKAAHIVNTTPRNIGSRAQPENKSALSINAVPRKQKRDRMPKSNLPKAIQAMLGNPAVEAESKRRWFILETKRYLEALARCVRECKRVDEASHFTRWLVMSGALDMLTELPQMAPEASALRIQANDMAMDCGELYKGGKANPKYAESDIAEINAKLDKLASLLPPDASINASPASGLLPADSKFLMRGDLRDSALLEAEHISKQQRDEVT